MMVDFDFMVGGEAGQGVQSISQVLGKTFTRGGYHVFADQDYESRIRGGHSFSKIRVKNEPVLAVAEPVHMLIALNKETVDLHRAELVSQGAIVYDSERVTFAVQDPLFYGVPLERLAVERGGNKIMMNSVALGAAIGLVNYDFNLLAQVLTEQFAGRGTVAENNVEAARGGYQYVREYYSKYGMEIKVMGSSRRMLLTGNDAIALGALAAGCKFMAGYPMTPSTPILEYLAGKAGDFGLAVVQPEDEISVINMVIGAAFAGARAMTATSGGGFCLMVEGLGLAGMTETPIVVVEGQRPGPAIGLPTRMEQGDLEFVIHASHGEFPRAVLAPATVEDAFYLTTKAFNLAEKYQTPVIILNDHYLATCYSTVDKFDLSRVNIERGDILSEEEVAKQGEYKRHQITESGISPRALPLTKGALVVTDADEHDEEGHLIESAEIRTQMVLKRQRKEKGIKQEIGQPWLYGPRRAETTLVGWGSTYGPLREAVDILRKEGQDVNLLHLNELWPFPSETVSEVLDGAKRSFVVENNATGQLAHLLRAETGKKITGKILKFDGRPFSPMHIVGELKKEVS
ncbi:MAG: 2-oxoacid:acceptor oxidoreductase subunit alpha [Chloroflexi bacterium]|nr:2-oxoacid:acceptor oxidoreductase subunit alpha [Chloroflexota bacterium]